MSYAHVVQTSVTPTTIFIRKITVNVPGIGFYFLTSITKNIDLFTEKSTLEQNFTKTNLLIFC